MDFSHLKVYADLHTLIIKGRSFDKSLKNSSLNTDSEEKSVSFIRLNLNRCLIRDSANAGNAEILEFSLDLSLARRWMMIEIFEVIRSLRI